MDVNLFKGNLDLILLSVLEREGGYGQDIAKRVQVLTGGEITLNAGSLYPALHRLVKAEWVESTWQESDRGGAPRKYYRLTEGGQAALQTKKAEWQTLRGGVDALLLGVCA